ncbi:DUF488 family protein [Burkholderia ambifaria]|nr:DUF488 family protein [Burkholderia ambifaria]
MYGCRRCRRAPSSSRRRWRPKPTPNGARSRGAFARKWRMAAPKVLDLLAALSATSAFSIGCYCEDERRCHRGVLRELLAERGAAIDADAG